MQVSAGLNQFLPVSPARAGVIVSAAEITTQTHILLEITKDKAVVGNWKLEITPMNE